MGSSKSKEAARVKQLENERDARQTERENERKKREAEYEAQRKKNETEREAERAKRQKEREKEEEKRIIERKNVLVLKEKGEAEIKKLDLQIIEKKGVIDLAIQEKKIEEENIKFDVKKEEGKQEKTKLKAEEIIDQRNYDLKVLKIEDEKEERIEKGTIEKLKEQNYHQREERKDKLQFVYNIAKLTLLLFIVCILLVFADMKINEYYQHHEILYKWSQEYVSDSKSPNSMQDSKSFDPDTLAVNKHIFDMDSEHVGRHLRIETVNRNNRLEIENKNQNLEPTRIIDPLNSAGNKENKRLNINSERWARESDSEWETLSDQLDSDNLDMRTELDSRNEEYKPIDQNLISSEEDSEFETQTSDSYLSILFYWILSTTLKTAVVTFLVSFLITKLFK